MISRPKDEDPPWYQHFWRLHRRLLRVREAYRGIPEEVLVDLAPFCCAMAPAATEREIGRRDVWLRIARMRQMRDEELAALYAGLSPEERFILWSPPGTQTFMEEE